MKIEKESILEIEEARVVDAESIAEIQKVACLETYPNQTFGITKKDLLGRLTTVVSKEKWEEVIASFDSKTFVAKVDKVVVGFFAKKKKIEDI